MANNYKLIERKKERKKEKNKEIILNLWPMKMSKMELGKNVENW
jgi:hypothetical protein